VDFSKGFKVIFNGLKFQVGRESGDMTISDLNGDGIFEITVPITDFYGFEDWRMTPGQTPLPSIIFKYDRTKRTYVPANPSFRKCLLKDIEDAERKIRARNDQRLGPLLAVVLDYLLIGEKRRAWQLFDNTYTLPDKSQVKADVMKTLNKHPAYRYLRRRHFSASLWSAPAWRRFCPRRLDAAFSSDGCDKSQRTKAVTGHRTPRRSAIISQSPTLNRTSRSSLATN
jgi:hypothetical protein